VAKDLTAALAALSEGAGYTTRRDAVLSDPPALPAIPARTGSALPTSGISGAGGGIASPLTETAFTDRLFYTQTILTTTDGFMSLVIQPVQKMRFTDANSAVVEIIYQQPI